MIDGRLARVLHLSALLLALSVGLASCSRSAGTTWSLTEPTPGSAEPPPLQPAAPSAASLPVAGDCNIEFLNLRPLADGQLRVDRFSDYIVAGWAIDSEHRSDGSPLRLHVTSLATGREWQTVPARRTGRADVVASRGGVTKGAWVYEDAGFEAVIPVETLPPGRYGLAVVITSGAGQKTCGATTRFEVTR